jgi:hypothetical protein
LIKREEKIQMSEKRKNLFLTGPKRQLLRIFKQLKEADLDKVASTMGVSIDYVKDLCQELVQDNLLQLGPDGDGEYTITLNGSRMQITGSHNKVHRAKNIEPHASSAITKKPDLLGKEEIEKDMEGGARRYSIGERIGEVKMSVDLPSPEQVETALRSNPQSSYDEIEKRLTSHTLICPAKGKEVPWHYCSACPHQKEIDFQRWTAQCDYEFNERRLNMVYGEEEIKALARGENGEVDLEEFVALPHVRCPLPDSVTPVDRCADCRYKRDGEWQYQSKKRGVVGWVLCGAPLSIEKRNNDSRTVKYGGKEWRAVPPRWK